MVRLPDEIKNYIYLNVCDLQIPMIIRGFDLLDKFELPFYEDKYFDVIYGRLDIDAADMTANFIELLCRDIETIIRSHKIFLNIDPSPRLEELVRIGEGLYRLQNLEDYYMVERILTTTNTNEMKFAQLMNIYTGLDLIVTLENITSVDTEFLSVLDELIQLRNNEIIEDNKPDTKRILTATFFEYIDGQDTVGGRLYNVGYDRAITFQSLSDLVPFSFIELIRQEYDKGPAYAAINILSLLMLCSDTREEPVSSYKAISETLVQDPNIISELYYLITNMHNEFLNYYRERIQEEVDEDSNQI